MLMAAVIAARLMAKAPHGATTRLAMPIQPMTGDTGVE
jgi:hypothetical protein